MRKPTTRKKPPAKRTTPVGRLPQRRSVQAQAQGNTQTSKGVDFPSVCIMGVGRKGSGKSTSVAGSISMPIIENNAQLVIWDVNGEHTEYPCAACLREVGSELIVGGAFRYQPRSGNLRAEFKAFVNLILSIQDRRKGTPLDHTVLLWVEELPDVTSASQGTDIWGVLVRRARHYRLLLAATATAFQQIDKTTLREWTTVHIHEVGLRRDAEYLAEQFNGDEGMADRIMALKGHEKITLVKQ